MRWNLAQNAKWIREQQAVVAAADDKAGKDALKVPLNRDSGPEWDTVRADQQATAPSRYLQSHLHRRLSARARTPNCADSEPVAHEPSHPRNPEDCAIGMATDRASIGQLRRRSCRQARALPGSARRDNRDASTRSGQFPRLGAREAAGRATRDVTRTWPLLAEPSRDCDPTG